MIENADIIVGLLFSHDIMCAKFAKQMEARGRMFCDVLIEQAIDEYIREIEVETNGTQVNT